MSNIESSAKVTSEILYHPNWLRYNEKVVNFNLENDSITVISLKIELKTVWIEINRQI